MWHVPNPPSEDIRSGDRPERNGGDIFVEGLDREVPIDPGLHRPCVGPPTVEVHENLNRHPFTR